MVDVPDFELVPPPMPPKRQKPKPTRKKRGRPLKKAVKAAPKQANGKYPSKVYELIGRLMNLELPLRNFVIEVTKGLSK